MIFIKMSFKTKNRKKTRADTRVTLDAKHNKKVEYFNELKDSLKILKTDINTKKREYFSLKSKDPDLSQDELNKFMDLKEDIKTLKNQVKSIENDEENIKYLLDNGHLLFQYYNNINDIAEGKVKVYNLKKQSNNKSVMEYFQSNNPKVETKIENEEPAENYKYKHANLTRAKIYDSYLSQTEENYIVQSDSEEVIDLCKICNVEKVLYLSEGIMICPCCGDQNFVLIDSDKPSFKDPPREVSYFAYKRINHFNEWLAQFQAK